MSNRPLSDAQPTGIPADATAEEQAYAFRTFGDAIQDIGLREFDHQLTEDEVKAARYLAEAVIAWCDR